MQEEFVLPSIGRRASIGERRASVTSMNGFAYRRQSVPSVDGEQTPPLAAAVGAENRRGHVDTTRPRRGSVSALEVVGGTEEQLARANAATERRQEKKKTAAQLFGLQHTEFNVLTRMTTGSSLAQTYTGTRV